MPSSDKDVRRDELLTVIRQVRRRWRLKLALRGLVVLGVAALLAGIISVWGMERFAFSAGAVTGFRVFVWLVVVAVGGWFLFRPLLRRVPDDRVALYLEEHEPSLEAAILSALAVGDGDGPGQSPSLVAGLVESAVVRARTIEYGKGIEMSSVRRSSAALAGLGVAVAAFLFLGPGYVRHGASALLNPLRAAEAANPYSIAVEPGDTTISRGSDQSVRARLAGFTSDEVDLLVRTGEGAEFERLPMIMSEDSASFEALLFDVDAASEYFVQSGGVRSALHRIEVADLPYVDRLELVYHFPDYTGLEPRVVEDGGDIAVLRGTTIEVRATPTLATPAGRIVLNDEPADALRPDAEGVMVGRFQVTRQGVYHIELTGPNGEAVVGSPRYTIDVLTDMPPSVRFTKPGRDTRVTTIEEVFLEARADDDYGVGELTLVYSVNGGDARRVPLFRGGSRPRQEVVAGHTFYLEELPLEPGDLISYWGEVSDNNAVGRRQEVSSDIYFLQIRPFRKDFRQADQGAMPGGGGGEQPGELSEQQRQIVAATFNVVRDRGEYAEADWAENVVTVRLAQERLRQQVETLTERMRNRMAGDSAFLRILELLPRAAAAMAEAEDSLSEQRAEGALGPEQRALQQLQRAEEVYRDVQLSFQQNQGGGGASSNSAEDLADLFELELDKLRNQYETVQRGQRQQMESEVDEALERLKELARRQQQEAERQRRLSNRSNQAAGGGGQAQRQLAEEAEETARQLERLARENRSPELEETARRLREAAESMRRSAASDGEGSVAEANSALDRLEEARRQLERGRSQQLRRDAQETLDRVRRLRQQQDEMEREVGSLGEPGQRDSGEMQRIIDRKELMADEIADIERELDQLAGEARREQREAADRLKDAANSIRDNKLKEKVRFSRGVVQGRASDYARQFEEQIGADIDELERRMEDAVGAVQQAGEDGVEQALDRTRDLVRGVESLGDRIEEGRNRGREQGQQDDQRPQGQQEGQQEGQQQGQQQGQQGEGGGDNPEGTNAGSRFSTGGGGDARPGGLRPDDVRQFRRELRERLGEAEDLRRDLRAENYGEVGDLDEVMRAMRRLDDPGVFDDPDEVARLQSQVVEGLKRFEFSLRRALEAAGGDRLFLSGSDEVPEGFRELVEEYYRSLSRDPEGGR